MPKKTAHTRSNVQRRRPKTQKSIELVRPASLEDEIENNDAAGQSSVGVATTMVEASASDLASKNAAAAPQSRNKKEITTSPKSSRAATLKAEKIPARETVEEDESDKAVEELVPAPRPTSASARIAARRQAAQKSSRFVSLISAENYGYVRRDLVIIAILAAIMFSAIIILHFVPAIGG
jgi:hypothetical protein